jgi:hypothetical protein
VIAFERRSLSNCTALTGGLEVHDAHDDHKRRSATLDGVTGESGWKGCGENQLHGLTAKTEEAKIRRSEGNHAAGWPTAACGRR